jgi:hypothetical protein
MKGLITIVVTVMTSVAYALPSDDFNDNSMDTSLWNLYEDNHTNAWLDETNRLEFRSTADAEDSTAVYFSNGWGFSTADNFSFKADFHCSSTSGPTDSDYDIILGLSKGVDETIKNNNVTIHATYYIDNEQHENRFYSYDNTTDGIEASEVEKSRFVDNGTLYISYDASQDKLYLSDTGYGATEAWITIQGLLQDKWGSGVVSQFLGGWTGNIALASGDAYLDNFVVDSGTIIQICRRFEQRLQSRFS